MSWITCESESQGRTAQATGRKLRLVPKSTATRRVRAWNWHYERESGKIRTARNQSEALRSRFLSSFFLLTHAFRLLPILHFCLILRANNFGWVTRSGHIFDPTPSPGLALPSGAFVWMVFIAKLSQERTPFSLILFFARYSPWP